MKGSDVLATAWLAIDTLLSILLTPAAVSAETKRIFAIPPTQWDSEMLRDRPAQRHSSSDLANLTGGIVFGLSPNEVNTKLPVPAPGDGLGHFAVSQ